MLIDAGNSHNGSEIISYIENIFEYNEIDFVVATHPHADHIGGMAEVISHFDVGAMYMPEKAHTSQTFEGSILHITVDSVKTQNRESDMQNKMSKLFKDK